MTDTASLQRRLGSCIETIVAIQASLDESRLDPVFVGKFKQLESSLRSIEITPVSEEDVQRVEDATNILLEELRFLYTTGEPNPIHAGMLH